MTRFHISLPEQVWRSHAKLLLHAKVAVNSVWVKREHLASIRLFERNLREAWHDSEVSRAATCYWPRATITTHAWEHLLQRGKKSYLTSCLNYACTARSYCYCGSDWGSKVLTKHICNNCGVNYTVQMGEGFRTDGPAGIEWESRTWRTRRRYLAEVKAQDVWNGSEAGCEFDVDAETGLKACPMALQRGKFQIKGETMYSLVLTVSFNTHALV